MECKFASDSPIKSLEWYKEGMRLLPTMRDYVISMTSQQSAMTIQESMPADSAIYTVRIFNEAGPVESSARLAVQGPCPCLLQVHVLEKISNNASYLS